MRFVELIPKLVRHGLEQLIELEVAALLGAERHEHTEVSRASPKAMDAQMTKKYWHRFSGDLR